MQVVPRVRSQIRCECFGSSQSYPGGTCIMGQEDHPMGRTIMAPQDRTDTLLMEWRQVCSENDGIVPALITHFLIHHCESKDCRRTKWWYWYKVRTLGRNSSRKKSLLNQWEGKRCPVKFSNHPLKSLIKSSTFSLQTERGLMRMTHCYTNKGGNRSRLASFPGPHHF